MGLNLRILSFEREESEMNKLLFCVSLVCLVGSCSLLELRSICEQDHFNYSNILVNAVHLKKKEVSLGKVSEFAIVSEDNCEERDGDRKFYDEYKDQLVELKRKQ